MRGAIPPSQHVFMAWCLVKHMGNFTFTYFCMEYNIYCMERIRNILRAAEIVEFPVLSG